MSRLPNALCVGTQKGATSSLYDALRQHPDIFLPDFKELHYFDGIAGDGIVGDGDIDAYAQFFKKANNQKIVMEVTPRYMYLQDIAGKIERMLGNQVKIIIILRHPIERALSAHKMSVHRGINQGTFKEKFYAQLRTDLRPGATQNELFHRGLYYTQVKQYTDRFVHVHIVLFEDFVGNAEKSLSQICSFLGVAEHPMVLNKKNVSHVARLPVLNKYLRSISFVARRFHFLNNTVIRKARDAIVDLNISGKAHHIVIDDAFYDDLYNYFIDDINNLEKLIEKDLSAWKVYGNTHKEGTPIDRPKSAGRIENPQPQA